MAVTAQTESNNTKNVFWVLGRVPMFTFDMNMKSSIFAHCGVISLLYLFVCMYISYKAHNRFTKETLLIVSDVDVYMFPVLRSIPSCTTDMNLRSCILNHHKMRQSQIATIEESLPSHFVICRILWSWPWRHKLSPITLKTCSGYLGEYPCSLLTWIWKVVFLPILVLFHWYICLCVCLSVMKLIIDVPRKTCWKGPILMWTCFLHLGVNPWLLWNLSEQLCFEPSQMRQSQIATIQESLPSHFVICRILWPWPRRHILSQITLKTCSGYLGEYPCSLLTWIWKVPFLPILGLFHCYICLCVCISVINPLPIYRGNLIDSVRRRCVHVSCTGEYTLLHYGHESEKLHFELSQNATVTNCDNWGILAVAFCDLSHFVIMAVTAQTESNNTENVFWVLGRVPRFTFDRNLRDWVLTHFRIICRMYCV